MLSRWSIRNRLLLGLGLLLVIVVALSWSGFNGLYSYRGLLKNLQRVNELPLAAELNHRVSDLRIAALTDSAGLNTFAASEDGPSADARFAREEFRQKLAAVRETLAEYLLALEQGESRDSPIGDNQREKETVERIRAVLAELDAASNAAHPDAEEQSLQIETHLFKLQALVDKLPEFLQDSISRFPNEVRSQYRRRIAVAWTTSVGTVALLTLLGWLTYRWVFRPLRVLIRDSTKVAAGRFDIRIKLNTHDEMAELAEAMNGMTERFQAIHDDLDEQVKERTRQVVRSEQLASVGFLAAGVAHDINDPLARIAACAEDLQEQLDDLSGGERPQGDEPQEAMLAPLRQIQDEAFRCKEITTNLLDLSRTGDAERHHVDLRELVQGMIDMVRHVGRYQEKQIELAPGDGVVVPVNARQMKQVVLNLLTQGLDSLEPGGTVRVELAAGDTEAELLVTDDGRGMTKEELEAVFEPSSRRRGGGTGLGLPIAARLVRDHGGCITASSAGLGHGAQFRVCLPLADCRPEQNSRIVGRNKRSAVPAWPLNH